MDTASGSPTSSSNPASQKFVWSGSKKFPDGTRRPDDGKDNRPAAPEASAAVHVPGYSQPLHRHDVAVDFRDAEIPVYKRAHGKHIVGFGIGATIGSTVGSALFSSMMTGTAFGGVGGAALGAFVGGILCGLIGVGMAQYFHPTDEDEYWKLHYRSRPYYDSQYEFERDYEPAYEFGYEIRHDFGGHSFEEVEAEIRPLWEKWRQNSRLDWLAARPAIVDAWDRYDAENAEHEVRPRTF